jgi:hypothetical protein
MDILQTPKKKNPADPKLDHLDTAICHYWQLPLLCNKSWKS